MWLSLLRELNAGTFNPYDYEGDAEDAPEAFKDSDPDRLDPIEPDLPGCIDMKQVRSAAQTTGWKPGLLASGVLTSEEDFINETLAEDFRERMETGRTTSAKFLACLMVLLTAGLLVYNEHHSAIAVFATFFTVAKSGGEVKGHIRLQASQPYEQEPSAR